MAKKKNDDYRQRRFYEGRVDPKKSGFTKFEDNDLDYFTYNANGEILLISQGYSSAAGRDNGIESVKKNRKIKGRVTVKNRATGRYIFCIIAGNGQEVARSVDFMSEAEASAAASKYSGFGKKTSTPKKAVKAKNPRAKSPAKTAAATAAPQPKKRAPNDEDNYHRLAFYTDRITGVSEGFDRFTAEDGHYFTYNRDGRPVLISEGYPTVAARETGLASVRKNMKLEERYDYRKLKNGKYDYRLKAGNHKEIARSVWYGSAAAATAGAAWLMGKRGSKPVAAAPIAAATVAAATIPAAAAAREPEADVPAVAAAATGGGFPRWLLWLLPLLLLLAALFFGLRSCKSAPAPIAAAPVKVAEPVAEPEPIPEPAPIPEPEPIPEPAPVPEPVPAEPVRVASNFSTCSSNAAIFRIPNSKPRSVTRLGTNPEFGNSHGLTPSGFYDKLRNRAASNRYDRAYLNYVYRSMGYSGFGEANASQISEVTLSRGTEGLLGYSARHKYLHARLDTSDQDLEAFRIEAANGCVVYYMKTCGNYFFPAK